MGKQIIGRGGGQGCDTHQFFFLAVLRSSMQDLSSPTRDQTRAPCSGSAES